MASCQNLQYIVRDFNINIFLQNLWSKQIIFLTTKKEFMRRNVKKNVHVIFSNRYFYKNINFEIPVVPVFVTRRLGMVYFQFWIKTVCLILGKF